MTHDVGSKGGSLSQKRIVGMPILQVFHLESIIGAWRKLGFCLVIWGVNHTPMGRARSPTHPVNVWHRGEHPQICQGLLVKHYLGTTHWDRSCSSPLMKPPPTLLGSYLVSSHSVLTWWKGQGSLWKLFYKSLTPVHEDLPPPWL